MPISPTSIARSNELAAPLLQLWARIDPLIASRFGIEAADGEIPAVDVEAEARHVAAYRAVDATLAERERDERDPYVASDLRILRRFIADRIDALLLTERMMLPYYDLAQLVFAGISQLLDEGLHAPRRPVIASRLRRFAGLAGDEPMQARLEALWYVRSLDATRVGPTRAQVERDLAQAPTLAAGIAQLAAAQHLGMDDAVTALQAQIGDYAAFVRREVLPRCRPQLALPRAVYAMNLRLAGVDTTPEDLAQAGRTAFADVQAQMNDLAPRVARERGWAETDYRAVVRALKREQIPPDDLVEVYRRRNAELEAIVRREGLVTVPQRGLAVRFATAAEDAGIPAPHYEPPSLIDNRGESGSFIISKSVGGSASFDDFSFEAATWTLCAHEARPGHDLQFAAMADGGVSHARAVFAFNSANCEGWALYAEDIVFPYLAPAAQLVSLQARLMRAARLFLDPELQLGRLDPDAVRRVLTDDVVLSDALATSELQRYAFIFPGQATSYYYGYAHLVALAIELKRRPTFSALRFHDFILAQGLVPPPELRQAAEREFAA